MGNSKTSFRAWIICSRLRTVNVNVTVHVTEVVPIITFIFSFYFPWGYRDSSLSSFLSYISAYSPWHYILDIVEKVYPTLIFAKFYPEAAIRRCSVKKVFLKILQIYRKTPAPESEACNFIKKGTLAQMFSCEFCEILKKPFLTEHLRCSTSVSVRRKCLKTFEFN